MARTTTDLLNSVKRRSQLPDDGGTLSDADILAFATDELQNVVYPRLMAMNEWHYAFTYRSALSSERSYRIDPRVAGNRITSVEYTADAVDFRFIKYNHPLTQAASNNVYYESYSIFGNNIVLSSGCPTSGVIVVRAVARPSTLVSTGCSRINSINTVTNEVTVDVDNFSAGDNVDILYSTTPYEFITLDDLLDVAVGSVYHLSEDVQSSYVSARLCPAGQSDRVQLPDELHDYLAQRVAIRCMEARGFTQDMDNHLRKLVDLEGAFDRLVAPRNKGEFKAIISEDWAYQGRP